MTDLVFSIGNEYMKINIYYRRVRNRSSEDVRVEEVRVTENSM